MVFLAALWMGSLQMAFASDGPNELQELLLQESTQGQLFKQTPEPLTERIKGQDRSPAVLGAATSEPSEHREMYLDFSEPESSDQNDSASSSEL